MEEAEVTREEVEEAKEAAKTSEEQAIEETQETSEKIPADSELAEKNKQLFARAKKAEEDLKKLKADKPSTPDVVKEEDGWKNKVEFLLQNKEYSEEEFDHIAGVSKNRNISLKEAAMSEKDYIQFKRQKANEENKVPSPSSSGSISVGDKTTKDIENMSDKEYSAFVKEQKEKAPMSRQGI